MSAHIVCLGNEMASDDGVGIRVGRILRTLPLPPSTRIKLRPQLGLELLDSFQAEDTLIVVDAMRTANHSGRKPGECAALTWSHQELQAKKNLFCCHGMGLSEILEIGRQLFPQQLPRQILVIGIEASQTEFGLALTESVQKALPRAVELCLRSIHAEEDLIRAGIDEAEKNSSWEPSPLQAYGG